MKMVPVIFFSALAFAASNLHAAGDISDASLGLSKTSVFDDPAPAVFEYSDTKARRSKAMPRAFYGAPPQVPHEVESMLPITLHDNQCLECHDRPEKIGHEKVKGGNPMDSEHYSAHGEANTTQGWELSGARYTCSQCHVPQAGVTPLVDNTF